MAGHSHYKSIKHKKAILDKKRSAIFARISREIEIAAKDGGNPDTNPKIRVAIERAREFNMPLEKIEKALQRGGAKLDKNNLEECIFEGIAPGGAAFIIDAATDNKNRSLAEIKQILSKYNAKLTGEGAIRWMFEKKGIIKTAELLPIERDEIETAAIESGAEDIIGSNDFLYIYTNPEELEKVKSILIEKRIEINSAVLGWITKETIELGEKSRKNCQKLFEELKENEAIQNIYSNIKI